MFSAKNTPKTSSQVTKEPSTKYPQTNKKKPSDRLPSAKRSSAPASKMVVMNSQKIPEKPSLEIKISDLPASENLEMEVFFERFSKTVCEGIQTKILNRLLSNFMVRNLEEFTNTFIIPTPQSLCVNDRENIEEQTSTSNCANEHSNLSSDIKAVASLPPEQIFPTPTCIEIQNGLSGMMRDTILHLCHVVKKLKGVSVWDKDRLIRTVMGMCQEYLPWRSHSYFVRGRMEDYLPALLRPHPSGKCVLSPTPKGPCCAFGDGYHTVFLDRLIDEGIYHWTVRMNYGKGQSSLFFGFAPPSLLHYYDEDVLACRNNGSCCFSLWKGDDGLLSPVGMMLGVEDRYNIPPSTKFAIDEGATVALELDAGCQTLSFFSRGKKATQAVSDVTVPCYLGVSGVHSGKSFTSLSLRRLPSPTPSTTRCVFHACCRDGRSYVQCMEDAAEERKKKK